MFPVMHSGFPFKLIFVLVALILFAFTAIRWPVVNDTVRLSVIAAAFFFLTLAQFFA